MPDFRVIPSIELLRQRAGVRELEAQHGADATVHALRAGADAAARADCAAGEAIADAAEAIEAFAAAALAVAGPRIAAAGDQRHRRRDSHQSRARADRGGRDRAHQPPSPAATAISNTTSPTGARGSRTVHAESLLTALTGAEAAIVVNNNAAATLLILTGLAAGREVVISRGELVEIGGGFRVPDVMRQSGAALREVGTTNRTRVTDYTAAVSPAHRDVPARASVEFPDRRLHRAARR